MEGVLSIDIQSGNVTFQDDAFNESVVKCFNNAHNLEGENQVSSVDTEQMKRYI